MFKGELVTWAHYNCSVSLRSMLFQLCSQTVYLSICWTEEGYLWFFFLKLNYIILAAGSKKYVFNPHIEISFKLAIIQVQELNIVKNWNNHENWTLGLTKKYVPNAACCFWIEAHELVGRTNVELKGLSHPKLSLLVISFQFQIVVISYRTLCFIVTFENFDR